jgi:lipopolysaccharide export system permease protein
MAPQAVLIATVITLASLARDNEIVAMKACGIGVVGITLPIIGASFVVALLVLVNNEYVAPLANERANYIFEVRVQNNPVLETGDLFIDINRSKVWTVTKDGAIWNIGQFDPDGGRMDNVSIFYRLNDYSIHKRIDAKKVIWDGKQWEFFDGFIRTFVLGGLDTTIYYKKKTFPVEETLSDFIINNKEIRSEELSLRKLHNKIQELTTEGKDTLRSRVEFHQKISYPFISIVLALLAIPLSLRSSRHGGVLFCVGVNLAVGFVFSFLYAMGVSLGFGGFFSPLFAAWGPFLFFSSLGFYLIFTLDSEYIIPWLKL